MQRGDDEEGAEHRDMVAEQADHRRPVKAASLPTVEMTVTRAVAWRGSR
ncbi:hypothetical protein ABGB08_27760 [Acrocarpospora sp. B8E8]